MPCPQVEVDAPGNYWYVQLGSSEDGSRSLRSELVGVTRLKWRSSELRTQGRFYGFRTLSGQGGHSSAMRCGHVRRCAPILGFIERRRCQLTPG